MHNLATHTHFGSRHQRGGGVAELDSSVTARAISTGTGPDGWFGEPRLPTPRPNCGPGEYAAEEVEECSPSPFFHTSILAMDTLPHHNLTTSLWYPFLWHPCCCLESSVDGRVSKAKLCHRSSHRRCRGRMQRAGKQFRWAAAGLRGL